MDNIISKENTDNFTKGKSYTIIERISSKYSDEIPKIRSKNLILVKDDDDKVAVTSLDFFYTVEEWRDKVLKDIIK